MSNNQRTLRETEVLAVAASERAHNTKIGQYSGLGMQPRQQLYLAWRNYLLSKHPTISYIAAVEYARQKAANKEEVPND